MRVEGTFDPFARLAIMQAMMWGLGKRIVPFILAVQFNWTPLLACDHCDRAGACSLLAHQPNVFAPGDEEKTKKKRLRLRGGLNTKHDSHYLFGPSAIPMEVGKGYYQNQDVVLHSAYFSPRQGLSFGGGIQLASIWSSITKDQGSPMFHLRVNGGGQIREGLYVGAFAMGLGIGGAYSIAEGIKTPNKLGLFAAQATVGKDRFHITTSIGISVEDGGVADKPLIGIAGLWHPGQRLALLTESWSIPIRIIEYRVYTYGVRFKHRGMAFDGCFAYNNELKDIFFLGAPVLGFSLSL
ncbi:MAG TPA: hypothetical protein PK760_05930 [Flavobacteriales bacterium]|nr:hypothetical protein [Flavobacteriales bacterium]